MYVYKLDALLAATAVRISFRTRSTFLFVFSTIIVIMSTVKNNSQAFLALKMFRNSVLTPVLPMIRFAILCRQTEIGGLLDQVMLLAEL